MRLTSCIPALALLLAAVAPAAPGPTAREVEEARRAFQRQYRSRHASARAAAVRRLAKLDTPWRVATLLRVLEREGSRAGDPGVDEVLDAAVTVLGTTRDPRSLEALVQGLVATSSAGTRREVLAALGAVRLDPAELPELPWQRLDELLGVLLDQEALADVLAGLDGVRALRRTGLCPAVIQHLEHPRWEARVAAIQTLRELIRPTRPEDATGLAALIGRLAVERGRVLAELREALRQITGWDCGTDDDCWRLRYEQWVAGRRGFDPATPSPPGATRAGGFFDIQITSEALLFVVDVSMSMLEPCEVPGATGDRPPPSKWEVVREELHAAIDRLRPPQRFGVLLFADHVRSLQDDLVPATETNRTRVLRRLDRVSVDPEGRTNMYEALQAALGTAGVTSTPDGGVTGVDTIIFLTDGMPTAGRISLATPVLDELGRPIRVEGRVKTIATDVCYRRLAGVVRRANRVARVRIDCVGFGRQAGILLRDLARDSGGEYTRVEPALVERARRRARRQDGERCVGLSW
jgi:hypothetical protein